MQSLNYQIRQRPKKNALPNLQSNLGNAALERVNLMHDMRIKLSFEGMLIAKQPGSLLTQSQFKTLPSLSDFWRNNVKKTKQEQN